MIPEDVSAVRARYRGPEIVDKWSHLSTSLSPRTHVGKFAVGRGPRTFFFIIIRFVPCSFCFFFLDLFPFFPVAHESTLGSLFFPLPLRSFCPYSEQKYRSFSGMSMKVNYKHHIIDFYTGRSINSFCHLIPISSIYLPLPQRGAKRLLIICCSRGSWGVKYKKLRWDGNPERCCQEQRSLQHLLHMDRGVVIHICLCLQLCFVIVIGGAGGSLYFLSKVMECLFSWGQLYLKLHLM